MIPDDDLVDCRECGEPCFVTDDGVSHHYDADASDYTDHDRDADHVAIPDDQEIL